MSSTYVPTVFSFNMNAGDSKAVRGYVTHPDKTTYDLSTATEVQWQLAKSAKGPALISKKMSTGGCAIGQDGLRWYAEAYLLPEDTNQLKGFFFHSMRITFSDGSVESPFTGTISISENLIKS